MNPFRMKQDPFAACHGLVRPDGIRFSIMTIGLYIIPYVMQPLTPSRYCSHVNINTTQTFISQKQADV